MSAQTPTVECRSLFTFHWLGACLCHLRRAAEKRVAFLFLFLGAGLVLGQPCAGATPGVFKATGSLVFARFYHTATLLPNGQVLVAGGAFGNGNVDFAIASAELYNPANGTWTLTGGLTTARYDHTATLLPNGKVLVAGGASLGTSFASAELYDPASGTWRATGSLATVRFNHTATLLPNGKVLVVGGDYGGPLPLVSAEVYDPASETWAPTGSLANAREFYTATLLPNGKVLVAGGSYGGGSLASAELYDPASETWTPTGSLANARADHTATLLSNGKVLVAGGYDSTSYSTLASAELYDPASGTWTATGSLGTARSGHKATLVPNGTVLVVNFSAELYDPVRKTWTATGPRHATAQYGYTATLLPNGKVLVAGGSLGYGGADGRAELYVGQPTLLNISTRLRVLTGDKALIGGFIITGTQPKTVIVRGIGPSLPVPGALADPVIEVHGPSGELLATNDNWNEALTRQQISDSGLAPTNDKESALWGIINPGAYTVILSGKNGGTGVGLIEVYDLDRTVDSELANISTRGFVDTGDNVMIGGLIVGGGSGGGTARVIVRALGPSIPVAGALADPTLELHDGSGTTIATNDNWKTRPDGSSQQAEIEATTIPPTNDLESALVRTLQPGNYTIVVRGTNSTTGVGLVEAYNLP
ncbi:MAG TPA: kelch repeat-containing protein [Chthoniobacterales bacterium]